MDKRIWSIITRTIVSVNRSIPRCGRRPKYSDVLIARMYFWAVWHDRPLCWPCDRMHYNSLFRPRALPSVSQFCRRVRTSRIEAIIRMVNERLSRSEEPAKLMFLDGKALPVSESTSDSDAKSGRGNGRFSRGYKLHALGAEGGQVQAFAVRPLNEHEVPVSSSQLVGHIVPGARVLADGNYDSDQLYGQVYERGAWLFTPLKGMAKPGSYRYRRMSPSRRWVMQLWQENKDLCWSVYRQRARIERIFSALSSFAGGLGPLPNWVRTLRRVTRWVTAKLAIYHARLLCTKAVA